MDVLQLDRTALHWAAANGNLEAVEALIEGGADLEAKDKVVYEFLFPYLLLFFWEIFKMYLDDERKRQICFI